MRILVSTDISVKPQEASRALVKLIYSLYKVSQLGQHSVHVHTKETLHEIKARIRSGEAKRPCRLYIPDKMPPREVPNCYFQPPQSDQWKRDHRTVTFFHEQAAT